MKSAFKELANILGNSVLYHPSSGWICHTPGQDPSHLDDDITLYMQHGLLPMASSFSSTQFTSVHPFCFHLDCFHLSQPPMDKAYPQLIPMKLGHHPQISQPWPDLWHSSLWWKGGEMQWKRQTIGTLKETRCHLWKNTINEFD